MEKNTVLFCQVGILLSIPAWLLGLPMGMVFGLAQIILLLIAHHRMSSFFEESKIFTPMLLGNIISIVFTFGGLFYFTWLFLKFVLPGVVADAESLPMDKIAQVVQDLSEDIQEDESLAKKVGELVFANSGQFLLASGMILSGFVAWAFLTRISLLALAQKTQVPELGTAGLLYLIGSLTTIFLVGFLLYFIGYIFHAIGYFKLRAE